jgi:D-sedoheptulose 7-phosphate isomerase
VWFGQLGGRETVAELGRIFREADSAATYVRGFGARLASIVDALDHTGAARLIELLERAATEDRTVFVLGNGGSGAVAAHWVNDLGVNSVVDGQPGYRVISLGDNSSSITAVGNDLEFGDVFTAQLRAGLRPSDVVIALSVSGNSLNIIRAVEYAAGVGATTVGFTGMDGGKLRHLVDLSIHTDSDIDEYGPIEDIFSVYMHAVTGYIAMRRGRHLHH